MLSSKKEICVSLVELSWQEFLDGSRRVGQVNGDGMKS